MQVGIVGTGLMGHALAERLLAEGVEVHVYNRHADRAGDLVAAGARGCETVKDLIERVPVIITMLADAEAMNDVLAFKDGKDSLAGKTLVQMATIAPAQSQENAKRVEAQGGRYLEAPVLGSIPEARAGTLLIMAGGPRELFTEMLPLLRHFSEEPGYIGEVGAGAALKLAMNQLIASLTAGFALSLGFVQRYGVDVDQFMDTVRQSALYAKTYDKKLDKYLSRDFGAANFSTRHLLKDIGLFVEDAQRLGLDTDALQGIQRITAAAVDQGMAGADYSSIYQVIAPANHAEE